MKVSENYSEESEISEISESFEKSEISENLKKSGLGGLRVGGGIPKVGLYLRWGRSPRWRWSPRWRRSQRWGSFPGHKRPKKDEKLKLNPPDDHAAARLVKIHLFSLRWSGPLCPPLSLMRKATLIKVNGMITQHG